MTKRIPLSELATKIAEIVGVQPGNLSSHDVLYGIKFADQIESYFEIGSREGCSAGSFITENQKLVLYLYAISHGKRLSTEDLGFIRENFEGDFLKSPRMCLCDTWGGKYGGTKRGNPNIVKRLLHNALGVPVENVEYATGDSKEVVPSRKDKWDLIYVDGDHSFKGAFIDLENCLGIMNKYIIFDDIYHPRHSYLDECLDKFLNKHRKYEAIKVGKNEYGTAIIALKE